MLATMAIRKNNPMKNAAFVERKCHIQGIISS